MHRTDLAIAVEHAPAAHAPNSAGMLRTAIVTSGTSRILVLRDEQLRHARDRSRFILKLFAREIAAAGLSGSHYQQNKVAVLEPAHGQQSFAFHFYQVDPQSKRLYSTMECSNAASAAAATAMITGLAPADDGCFHSQNLATRQHVELTPPAGKWWNGNWGVRFTKLHHVWEEMTRRSEAFSFEHRGMTVNGTLVRHGNVFVITALPPSAAEPELVERLARLGNEFAARRGLPANPAKMLFYTVDGFSNGEMVCTASCYSEGQRHHSLPGSAAMAMGAFMTANGFLVLASPRNDTSHAFRFKHPSGSMGVHVQLTGHPVRREVRATSFETPVRVLMHGELLLQ